MKSENEVDKQRKQQIIQNLQQEIRNSVSKTYEMLIQNLHNKIKELV